MQKTIKTRLLIFFLAIFLCLTLIYAQTTQTPEQAAAGEDFRTLTAEGS